MWILKAIFIHILLLGSVFVIYFRSPVISDLNPQADLTELGLNLQPPAKRLVLIVTDGLRAESFFGKNCGDIPNLRRILLEPGGLAGISHTRVPTESRPGHIALIAGLYEDPSAVTRGWKENPIDFDTLFNRSRSTYAFGANDVLHIFSRIHKGDRRKERHLFIDAYDHDLDFSGRNDTKALDDWVFKKVKLLLHRKKEELQNEEQIVFFMHLLGLDSAGHIHKPGSERFLENLHSTERGVYEMYKIFEDTFKDKRTAYVLTADHGMTDAGSHGAGAAHETETPFLLWGAGIKEEAPNSGKTFQANDNIKLPLYQLEQAQLAPLMSVLIGLAPPMNNFGTLPLGYLKTSDAYEAAALYVNALQLLEQFRKLYEGHQGGLLAPFLKSYGNLDFTIIEEFKSNFSEFFEKENYKVIKELSSNMMENALEGIDYYHGYYRNVLLLCTTGTFLGWIFYLMQLLVAKKNCGNYQSIRMSTPVLFFVATLVLMFVYLQQVPFGVAIYLLMPVFVWMMALQQRHTPKTLWTQYKVHKGQLLLLICCAEILVIAFFQREIISVAFLVFALLSNWKNFQKNTYNYRFAVWLCLVLTLIVFPMLTPLVGYKNDTLLVLGMFYSILRPLFVKTHLKRSYIGFGAIGILNALLCIYLHNMRMEVPKWSLMISWCFLIYSFGILIYNRTTALKSRLELIFFSLTTLYSLLCTSYETIFVIMLASELLFSLATHEASFSPSSANTPMPTNTAQQLQSAFRLAFAILLYTFFSFFGTGNIASVSSFDPNIIRCFLTTFLPFVIMGLVVLKLIIPVILNISIIYAMSDFARHNEREIFICLLLICDIMGLNFLFLVRNRGSWLDIGTSISHFVIMEVTTVVLMFLTLPAKLFLRLHSVAPMSLKLK